MKTREIQIDLASPSLDVAFHEAMKKAREIAPSVYEFEVRLMDIKALAYKFGREIEYLYIFDVVAEEFYKEEE